MSDIIIKSAQESRIWPSVRFSSEEDPVSSEFVRALAAQGRKILQEPGRFLPMAERIKLLSKWAARWRNPDSPWRRKARLLLPQTIRLSAPMIEKCIDLFFGPIKNEALYELVQKLGGKQPQLVGHILPSNVLAASVESLILEVALGNLSIVKASSRSPLFPLLIVESFTDMDVRLGQYVSLVCWKGGKKELDKALAGGVDRLILYGTQETIGQIETFVSGRLELELRGPGFSVGIIEKEWARKKDLSALARKAACDVALYDQRGCLSLQTVFVERGGEFSPEEFAKELAKALHGLEAKYPLGERTVREAATNRIKKNTFLIRELSGENVFQDSDSLGRYGVLFEPQIRLDEPISGRLATVRPFTDISEILRLLDRSEGGIQGLALPSLVSLDPWRDKDIVRVAEFGSLHSTSLGWQKFPFGRKNTSQGIL